MLDLTIGKPSSTSGRNGPRLFNLFRFDELEKERVHGLHGGPDVGDAGSKQGDASGIVNSEHRFWIGHLVFDTRTKFGLVRSGLQNGKNLRRWKGVDAISIFRMT